MLQAVMQRLHAICLGWEFTAEHPEALARVIEQALAQGGIDTVHQLAEALGSVAGDLTTARLLVLLPLFFEEAFHVGMLRQEQRCLLAPRIGKFGEGLYDLTRLDQGRFGYGPSLSAEGTLVDLVGF